MTNVKKRYCNNKNTKITLIANYEMYSQHTRNDDQPERTTESNRLNSCERLC